MLVRTPPETMVSPSEEVLTARREAKLQADEASRAARVRTAFDAWSMRRCRRRSSADWIDIDGIAEMVVEDRGRRADYLVIGAAVHDTTTARAGMPCAPPCSPPIGRSWWCPQHFSGDFGRRVAIAWRDDERATKAVLPDCAA